MGRSVPKIDDVDRGIMAAVSANPQESNRQIAQMLGVSEMTIANRMEALIEQRLMKVTVQRDIRTAGFDVLAFVDIFVSEGSVLDLAQRLGEIAEVQSVTVLADEPQIVVLLMARDVEHFLDLVENRIGMEAGVGRIDTSICLDTLHIKPGIAVL